MIKPWKKSPTKKWEKYQNQLYCPQPSLTKHFDHTLLPFGNLETMRKNKSYGAALEVREIKDWEWKFSLTTSITAPLNNNHQQIDSYFN